MKLLHVLALALLLPVAAVAQETGPDAAEAAPSVAGPFAAGDAVLADQLYVRRPVVIFADSPNDPNFIRQMELIGRGLDELAVRDVIVVTDTDPAARSEWRKKLRPRGFSLVLMDKDLRPVIRKPLPWDVREITHAIDKFPLRRQEIQQGNAAGG